MDNTNFREIF